MRKNYWKECCLLLIGSLIGCTYNMHINPLLIHKTDTINNDTVVIHDTILIKEESKVYPVSKKRVLAELKRQNIPHYKIVLAQSIHETGNYKSQLCVRHNNIFGLKKGNTYRHYNNYVECIADYKKLISNRYKKGEDYYQFLNRIGYASDPDYINKIKKLV